MTSENIATPPEAASAGVDHRFLNELVARAQAEGLQLTCEGGLLQQLTKRLLESALEGEMTDRLGYDRRDPAGKNGGNSRNGQRSKTVVTDVGSVEIEVLRDREGVFELQIVKKRQRRLTGVDEMVLSLSAKGLTHGEIPAHLAEVCGAEVSKQTTSTITDSMMEGMAEWQARPLDRVYPVIFIDRVNVKIRDGQVANRPIYIALAVTTEGHRDILGLWAGGMRRRRQTLVPGPDGAEEPRRRGRPRARLRRVEGPARRGRRGLAQDRRPDLRGPRPGTAGPQSLPRSHRHRTCGRAGAPVGARFGCDQNMWRLVLPALAEDYRVVLFDYVGSGRADSSAWDERRYSSLRGYAEDVLEVCEELDLQDVTFVGHSVSAMVGVLAAGKAPRRFARLVMVALLLVTSTMTGTGAGSARKTSRSCWSRWSRTIWGGRRRWPR